MAMAGGLIGVAVFLSVIVAFMIPFAVIWLVVVVIRKLSGEAPRARYDPAADALRYRFARGEMTEAEFEAGMRSLGYEKR